MMNRSESILLAIYWLLLLVLSVQGRIGNDERESQSQQRQQLQSAAVASKIRNSVWLRRRRRRRLLQNVGEGFAPSRFNIHRDGPPIPPNENPAYLKDDESTVTKVNTRAPPHSQPDRSSAKLHDNNIETQNLNNIPTLGVPPKEEQRNDPINFGAPSKQQQHQQEQQQEQQHRTIETIETHCEMTFTFFDGQGKQQQEQQSPTDVELDAVMFETDRYFTDLLSENHVTSHAFVGFETKNVHALTTTGSSSSSSGRGSSHEQSNSYYDNNKFFVTFDFHVEIVQDYIHEMVTLDDIHHIIDTANISLFITDYVWMSPPRNINPFSNTHAVMMKCYDNQER